MALDLVDLVRVIFWPYGGSWREQQNLPAVMTLVDYGIDLKMYRNLCKSHDTRGTHRSLCYLSWSSARRYPGTINLHHRGGIC